MMDSKAFRKYAHEFVDWMADYMENVADYPVKSGVKPGEVYARIPDHPPGDGEEMAHIFKDFQQIIMPGMTHWQSPNYFAYFNANSSYPSVLAEMLTATLGAQCMVWETSPAAAELEEKVMGWLRAMIGLPPGFEGVIQDTASTATLVAMLTARERATEYQINEAGFGREERFRIYASSEAHSSIEKAVRIAGFGKNNLVKVRTDKNLAMDPDALADAMGQDLVNGLKPLCVVAALGTTGSAAIDPLEPIGEISRKYGAWLHVDAAYAGTALVLPEQRGMIRGVEMADSFVFNPHKWMFTNFDCTAYFVKDTDALIRTFEILPEYLKTGTRGQVNDYRDWGIQLGRRFRALKLWFVIRDYGTEGIREKVRNHIHWAGELAAEIKNEADFSLFEPQNLGLVCFRYAPVGLTDNEQVNTLNMEIMKKLNDSGKIYLTHTRVNDQVTLRLVVGQTHTTRHHVFRAWELVKEMARSMQFPV